MSRKSTQRGPLLSSVVMVMLATMATGLLAFVGLQALPDGVIASSFGGSKQAGRHVNVSDSPTARPVRPVVAAATPTPTVEPQVEGTRTTRVRRPRTSSPPAPATTKPTATTAPKPTASAKPTTAPKPSPTRATQTPSPSPTCGHGKKPKCPKNQVSNPYSASSYDATDAASNDRSKAARKSAKH